MITFHGVRFTHFYALRLVRQLAMLSRGIGGRSLLIAMHSAARKQASTVRLQAVLHDARRWRLQNHHA